MHGRKKTGIAPTAEEAEAVSSKVQAYKKLSSKLLDARNAITADSLNSFKQLSVDMLTLQAQLLKVNPDFYTMWNHRKELLLAKQFQESNNDIDVNDPSATQRIATAIKGQKYPPKPFSKQMLENELSLSASCIKKQPKSYGAWHHRLWVVQGHVKVPSIECQDNNAVTAASEVEVNSEEVQVLLKGELYLCAQLLELDQRNFHCWAYRHYITRMANVSDDDEMDYTMEKIEQNFSNYSAFHYRSKILENCLLNKQQNNDNNEILVKGMCDVEVLQSELEMVCQAAFTEPEDQSAWWYHRFLLDWGERALCTAVNDKTSNFIELVKNEITQLRELRDSDSSYKWAHISLANSIDCLKKHLKQGDDASEVTALNEEYKAEMEALIQLDPSRSGYYKSLLPRGESRNTSSE